MSNTKDLGQEAVQRIARLWQVNDNRVVWTEQGFDWWPGRFKVSVKSLKGDGEGRENAWKLSIRTDFLKDVPLEDEKSRLMIALMSCSAPSYAWVCIHPEHYEIHNSPFNRRLWYQSSVYLRKETFGWLPEFLGRMAILQPIKAEIIAEEAARLLGGQPDVSTPYEDSAANYLDEMLDVATTYAHEGQKESRWKGEKEFEDIANQYGRSDICFGTGDSNGLTLETPIGADSALIQLHTDVPHPAFGSGLLASVQLPFRLDQTRAAYDCIWMNYFQSTMWSEIPQLASWHMRKDGAGNYRVANAVFYPNALYADGLATFAALSQVQHARWIKQMFYESLEDKTMREILEERMGTSGHD